MPITVIAALSSEKERQAVEAALSGDSDVYLAAIVEAPDQLEPARMDYNPDVIIVSSQFADDQTYGLVERLSSRHPPLQVIVIASVDDSQLIRNFVRAGAADVIPLASVRLELPSSLRLAIRRGERRSSIPTFQRGPEPGKIFAFYGPKGGIGTSLLSVNTAVALASRLPQPVALVDLSLQFGSATMLLNLSPDTTIASLAQRFQGDLDWEGLQPFMLTHPDSGLQLLAAPTRPELADLISTLLVEKVLQVLRNQFSFVIVDTATTLNDITLSALDTADAIVIVTALDVLALRNTQLVLGMFRKLYPSERFQIVLNRANAQFGGLTPAQVEELLDTSLSAQIPSDGQLAVSSLNDGVPFILRSPQSPLSQAVFQLAGALSRQPMAPAAAPAPSPSLFGRLFRFLLGTE